MDHFGPSSILLVSRPDDLDLAVDFQGPVDGGVSNGVSRSGLVLPVLSFFVPSCPFWDFPDFSQNFPDWSFSSQHLRGTVPKGSATQSGPS